jgi:pimeloyl-ACP methyl ester carboxylesterase
MLYMLTGEYDPNTSPAETKQLANLVKGSKFWVMEKLGHFPVTEDYIANFENICCRFWLKSETQVQQREGES